MEYFPKSDGSHGRFYIAAVAMMRIGLRLGGDPATPVEVTTGIAVDHSHHAKPWLDRNSSFHNYSSFMLSEKLDLRRILSHPLAFRLFQSIIRRKGGGARHARDIIRAKAGNRILDIGCGPGDVLDHLPEVDYHGFDLNEAYIEYAKKKYAGRGQFYCQSVEKAALPGAPHSYDIVMANAIIHHLSDTEAADLFRLAHHALKPEGRLVTIDGCYVEGQSAIAKYLLSRDRGRYVRTAQGYLALAKSTFATVDHKIYEDLARLPYTHIVLECTP